MKIIVDAFGGDNAPAEILKGAAAAVAQYGVDILLVGDEAKIKRCADENVVIMDSMEILNAPDIMGMDDDAMDILKEKKQSSMAVGLRALAEGCGDAFVSAGSTAALVIGGTFYVKRIKGIKRAAIATVMPSDDKPFMLIDSGANVEVTPAFLNQFAIMGNIYMNRVMGVADPKVGLANIGTEATKGTQLYRDSYELLNSSEVFDFIGNVEVRDIAFGAADVIVADGFTGNVILKMYEGVAGALSGNIKRIFKKNILTMLGALFVKSGLDEMKKKMDYKQFGGAPLMGLTKPVIKAHGSADARAFKNAIKQAVDYAGNNVISIIAENLPAEKEAVGEE